MPQPKDWKNLADRIKYREAGFSSTDVERELPRLIVFSFVRFGSAVARSQMQGGRADGGSRVESRDRGPWSCEADLGGSFFRHL